MLFRSYDYWTVDLPAEAFDSPDEACIQAIHECRERARTWRVPAEWGATVIAEGYELAIRVCRKTRRA